MVPTVLQPAGPPAYGVHDVRFDQAWIAALELGKELKSKSSEGVKELVDHVRAMLHPESIFDGSAKHLEYDPTRKLALPDYLGEMTRALDLVGADDAAALQVLGQACWDVFKSHPEQFSLKHLKKVWPKRPE